MHGLSDEEVDNIRNSAIAKLTEQYGDIEIIDNYHHENAPDNAGRLWHLGASIQQLEEADAIYFCEFDSNECIDNISNGVNIEMLIASLYNIRILNFESLCVPSLYPNFFPVSCNDIGDTKFKEYIEHALDIKRKTRK